MTLYGSGDHPVVEMLIDGVWTDVSSRVRGDQKIAITRGRANEQNRTSAQTCGFTLENSDGFFSNRMPTSVNYGKITKNTQVRVSAGSGDNYVRFPWCDPEDVITGEQTMVSTVDKAVLDVTGDIDIRAEIWPHTWRPNEYMILASKWDAVTGNNRSWVFYISADGQLYFSWTVDGSLATRGDLGATANVPATSGRLAVRFTLDVNNGAGGKTANFYTAPSIAGPWTALGSAVVQAGTTSIFNSTASLVVGTGETSQGIFSDGRMFGGKFYKLEVYNGIAGTRVANMDATSRAVGDTSWSDGLTTPNTWFLEGTLGLGRITTDRLRFWGELSSLPQQWDKTGTDVTIPATASGMIRRLTQGAVPLRSAMYRNFVQYNPHGYWTFEDGSDSVSAASAVSQGRTATATAVRFAAATDLPGAERTLQFTDPTSKIVGVTNVVTTPISASVVFYVKLSSLPASTKVFATFTTSGTARKIEVGVSSTAWNIQFFTSDGTSLGSASTAISLVNPTNQWIGYNLLMENSGSDMNYSVRWDVVGGSFTGGIGPNVISSASVGRFTGFTLSASSDTVFNDAAFGHMFFATGSFDLTNDSFRDASNGYLGETAGARMVRLSSEEGIPLELTGMASDTETMGYQGIKSFMDLVYECWDADGGLGGEARDALALAYRTRVDMERREDVTLSYAAHHLSETPTPVVDDQGVTNDVTAHRSDGSFARVVVTDGPNSIQDPPDGIGRYDTDVTVNVYDDGRLSSIAGWMALVGTWDQDRYPRLDVALHRSAVTSAFDRVIAADLGDTLVLADLPDWMPPDDVAELIQGYAEVLGKFTWDIVFNATPAGPYQAVPLLGSNVDVPRLDANEHTIGGSLTTTATSVSLVTPAGSARWVDSATYPSDFPFDAVIAGEVVTVTAITGTSSPQTATVTRSVNGVVKSHSAGELIRLAEPFYLGR